MAETDITLASALIVAAMPTGIYIVAVDLLPRYFYALWALTIPLMLFDKTFGAGVGILILLAIIAIALRIIELLHQGE